ncbi:MAG: deoxyribose-phosphate aldolase [Zestosphaera sp.]
MLDLKASEVPEVLKSINSRIDQTMLKHDKDIDEYLRFAEESDKYSFRALVVPSTVVHHITPVVRTSVAGVAGFPYGYHPVSAKVKEIELIGSAGGKEVDVVLNIVNVKSKRFEEVDAEVRELVESARSMGLGIKIIVETSALTDEELARVCGILLRHRPDFIKTNTGFGSRGVSPRDVVLIKKLVGGELRIKASGGVRNAMEALNLVLLGADVIGTSSGVEIIKDRDRILELILTQGGNAAPEPGRGTRSD